MEEARPTDLTDGEDDLIDIVMSGGPPWGFNISGGCEFGTRLFVGKVAEEGIARKVGGLKENDTLVYINDVKYTSRAKAIEAVRFGKNELKLKIRRNPADSDGEFVVKSGPKRSRSFYDSVVENMLENMSNDITSTHYSNRRSGIRGDGQSPIKANSEANESANLSSDFAEKDEQKENLKPENEFMGMRRTSSGNVQKVTIKSVNVTAMVPKAKDVISDQVKAKLGTTDGRDVSLKKTELLSNEISEAGPQNKATKVKDEVIKQTRSVDEADPTFRHFSANPSGLRKTEHANRYHSTEKTDQESSIETPALSVSKARAMFEEISKSQENLSSAGTKSRSTDCLLKSVEKDAFTTASRSENQDVSPSVKETALKKQPQLEHKHSHTKSLPSDTEEFTRRVIRRPGSAPHRRSERNMKAKSAHFPSEKELFQSQNLPLGYADVSSSSGSIHGRKSIGMCAPSYQYKKESSFRHSSEDLRPSDLKDAAIRKAVTLPANKMREAAKKFHQDLMRRDPKFRYSLSTGEPSTRPAHLGSFTGGSSGSSVGSSQDMLNTIDLSRRASGPTFFTRASSTSSLLDSPTSHQDNVYSPADEDDNSILSRLIREQRMNSGGNLVRIEEEARSPRSKTAKNRDGVLTSEIEEPKSSGSSKTRTMSIQTDFVCEASAKNEVSQPRPSSKDKLRSPASKELAFEPPKETDLDSIDRSNNPSSTAEETIVPRKSGADFSQDDDLTTSHEKEPSTDSVQELQEINDSRDRHLGNTEDADEDFSVPDIDALPPPPDDLLIGSPPEKEKPQRVINRKKRDQHSNIGSSRNSSCVSTDSTISNSTSDSGIGVRAFSTSESPRTSPTRETAEFDDYDKEHSHDEGFKSSREALDEDEYGSALPTNEYQPDMAGHISPARLDTPGSSRSSSRPDSMILISPKIEELDQEKAVLVDSMRKKIEELKSQEREIADEIKVNEDLGKKVRHMVETKAMQSEFSKYELFIGELNKIVALLLSLTQRLHRYEQMLQDLDMSEEEDKEKRDNLVAKIEKLKSQHEEACYLREVNDKRGENVANFLDKYFNEEEFQDFLYYVDMKSQLALMQSEIKEKVKLGEERYKALANTGIWTASPDK